MINKTIYTVHNYESFFELTYRKYHNVYVNDLDLRLCNRFYDYASAARKAYIFTIVTLEASTIATVCKAVAYNELWTASESSTSTSASMWADKLCIY